MIEGEDLEDLPMGDPEKVPDEADMDKANDIRYSVYIYLLRYCINCRSFCFYNYCRYYCILLVG